MNTEVDDILKNINLETKKIISEVDAILVKHKYYIAEELKKIKQIVKK
jgi:hypothetical protein